MRKQALLIRLLTLTSNLLPLFNFYHIISNCLQLCTPTVRCQLEWVLQRNRYVRRNSVWHKLIQKAGIHNLSTWPDILRFFFSKRNKNYFEYKLNLEPFIFTLFQFVVQFSDLCQPQNFLSKEMHIQTVTIHFSPTGFYSPGTQHNNRNTMVKMLYSQCNTHKASYTSQFLPTLKHTPNIIIPFSYSANLHYSNLSPKILTVSKQ